MPAINFPEQPGLQTPENTFSPVSVPESSKNGITYTYDNGVWSVAPIEIGGGTGDGNASIITSDYPPNNPPPKDGDLWWNTSNNTLYIYYVDEDTSQWVVSTPNDNNGGAQIDVGEEPPSSPTDGALWWNTDDNTLYIYYDEGDGGTSQWVIASPGGSGGSGGVGGSLEIPASDEPPTLPSEGDLWWSTTDNTLYIYYRDEDTEQWVVTVPSAGVGTLQQVTDAGNNTTNDITLGTDKITLDATDGSAEFAGNITLENRTDPYGSAVVFRPQSLNGASGAYGSIQAVGSVSTYGTDIVFQLRGGNTGGLADINEVARFKYDGSATFAGGVAADYLVGNRSTTDANILQGSFGYDSGTTTVVKGTGIYLGASLGNVNGPLPTGTNLRLETDGNIIASAAVRSNTYDSGAGYSLFRGTDWGGIYFKANSNLGLNSDFAYPLRAAFDGFESIILRASGNAYFYGNITAGNVSFNLEPDNDDNYTTTTDDEGNETRVYNGPTLDVKDRLTKTQDALTALRAAAQDNATDLAGLKAAIVTALSDI